MKKLIRSALLLTAGLIFVAHMIIPHDHHVNGSLGELKENCPVSGERSGHRPHFPLHCHAFNDITAEKFTPVLDHGGFNFTGIIISSHNNHVKCVYLSGMTLPDAGRQIINHYISYCKHFRAPPSQVR